MSFVSAEMSRRTKAVLETRRGPTINIWNVFALDVWGDIILLLQFLIVRPYIHFSLTERCRQDAGEHWDEALVQWERKKTLLYISLVANLKLQQQYQQTLFNLRHFGVWPHKKQQHSAMKNDADRRIHCLLIGNNKRSSPVTSYQLTRCECDCGWLFFSICQPYDKLATCAPPLAQYEQWWMDGWE